MQSDESKQVIDFRDDYPRWKDEYKSEYKILIPDMLPWHFAIITAFKARRLRRRNT